MRSITMILGLLFIALSRPSFAQKGEAAAAESAVRVAEGAPLTVECALRVEQRAQWRRDGGALPADLRPAGEAAAPGGGLTARLHAAAARAAHQGVYSCARGPAAARVRVLVLPAHGPETSTVASDAATTAAGAAADDPRATYVYTLAQPIELDCKADDGADLPPGSLSWTVNGTAVAEGGRAELREQGAVLHVARGVEDDWGNYSCLLGGRAVRQWLVRAQPVLRLPADSNVVEGQKLKLTCRVLGRPPPPVAWSVLLDGAENETDVETALAGRARLLDSAAGVPGGELLVEAAQRADAGRYRCRTPSLLPARPGEPAAAPSAETVLRVKDMYAALWPFLGICAEVFILCAIILVYEKRRTKPELDDSDTDNHEQKKS